MMSLFNLAVVLTVIAALAAIPRQTRKAAILVFLLLAALTTVAYASVRVEKPGLGGSGPLALSVPAGLTAPDYHEPLANWRTTHFAYVQASDLGETECLGCHADPDAFCNRCHGYVGVRLIAAPSPVGEVGGAGSQGMAAVPDFSSQVQPLLRQKCAACHGVQSGLSVASRADLLKGGLHGPAIVPGDAEASLLIQALRGTWEAGQQMPLGSPPLTNAEIDLIARWIEAGAN
ncbi:MAG: c-type cytochrome domain-containing protein [Anaerolineae bacterium]